MCAEASGRLGRTLAAFDPELPLERARTPPAAWYTDPAVAELEGRVVFGRSWQCVGRVDQLREPGAFVAGNHGGLPWVVVRGGGGPLAAFVNVCRHKAAAVAQGAGRVEGFTCPYHGWTYGLDGRLATAPGLAGIRDFDREACALLPLAVDSWGPLVFVNGDLDAGSVAATHPELDAALGTSGWDRLTFVERREYELACNWKVFCDNYLDGGYHIAHMHPTLDAQLDMSSYRTELFERGSLQSSSATGEQDSRIDYDAGERIGGGTLYAWLHPNLMLNRYGPVLDINLVLPLGSDRCRVIFDFYFEDPGDTAFVAASLAQSEITQQEDMAVSASVQAGLASGRYEPGRYAPRWERAMLHFHRLLAADLRGGLDGLD